MKIIPYLSWDEGNTESIKTIKSSDIIFNQRKYYDNQADFDVVFSESSGASRFEKLYLGNSKLQGKINIKLNNSISLYNSMTNPYYIPDSTKYTLDGIYVKGTRTLNHFKKFAGEDIFFIQGGDPDWDQFNTKEFKDEVASVKKKYGDKLLVLGSSCLSIDEVPWTEMVVQRAVGKGFSIIIQIHAGRHKFEYFKNPEINKCINTSIPRYILFASASHIITNMSSSLIAEGMLLGKRVGCNAFVTHLYGYKPPHVWIDNFQDWRTAILPKIGQETIDIIPRIHNQNELDKFLSTNKPYVDNIAVDAFFGWKRRPNYCEFLFQEVERKVMPV
ncbi:MAG: hypothetical protein ACXAC2_05800 [Candidatus Kariarchaeaceae archaeon]|jgi:hypothetical protein